MRRILVCSIAAVGLGLACLGGCAGQQPPGTPDDRNLAADEGITIRITMVGSECRLLDPDFLKIWSYRGHTVVWRIQGECTGVNEITVGQFTLNGNPLSPVDIRRAARPTTGSRIVATVKNDVTSGIYRYIALFDGRPAEVRVLGGKAGLEDSGEFEVCPVWPCS